MARIVFDLDGTLIDSAPDIRALANAILAREGAAPLTLEETRSFIGNGAAVFVTRMRAARGIPDGQQLRLLSDFLSGYDAAVDLTVPYPAVPAALAALRAEGHRLGVCTNKPVRPCRAVLQHLGLLACFDATVGGDSTPHAKPDPTPLRAAFEALGSGHCLYVGDSEIDAETAARAGIPFLLFTEGYRKSAVSEMNHVARFDRFERLPGLVQGHLDELQARRELKQSASTTAQDSDGASRDE
jgi:phosphoglycolate phosphatase